MRRETVCAICGLVACVHLVEIARHEGGAHADRHLAVAGVAVRGDGDHTHENRDGAVRLPSADVTMSGSPSDTMPPRDNSLDIALQMARRRHAWNPALYNVTMNGV